MKLKAFIASSVNKLWLSVASIIIIFAFLVIGLRVFLPYLGYYKSDIESFLSEKLGVQVKIEAIDASWEEKGPQFIIKNLVIHDISDESNRQLLQFNDIFIGMDFWQSLLYRQWITHEIKINDSNIHVNIDADIVNQLGVDRDSKNYNKNDFLLDILLGQNDVQLKNITFHLHRKNKVLSKNDNHDVNKNIKTIFKDTSIELNFLNIYNYGELHQIVGELHQEGEGRLLSVLELYGDPRKNNAKAQFYLKSHKISLPELPWIHDFYSGNVEQGLFDTEVLATWSYDGWQNVALSTQLSNLKFAINDKMFRYDDITTALNWIKLDRTTGKTLLKELKVTEKEQSVTRFNDLELTYINHPDKELRIQHSNIQLGQLNSLWALLIQEPHIQKWFLTANPQLNLNSIDITLKHEETIGWFFEKSRIDIAEFIMQRTDSTPSMSPMQGWITLDKKKYDYVFSSKKGEMDYRPLFRSIIPFKQLNISGSYYLNDSGTQLSFKQFLLETKDLKINALGNLNFEYGQDAEISLYTELLKANAKEKSLYLPVKVMSKPLIEFLDNSIKDGEVSFAQLHLQGRLVPNILGQVDTVFEIMGQTKNLDFQYIPGWPKLDRLDADLFFTADSVDIETRKASLWGINITQGKAAIPSFIDKDLKLLLDIQADFDGKNARKFVDSSPLKNILGNILYKVRTEDDLSSQISVDVPLNRTNDFKLKGRLNLKGINVFLPDIQVLAEDVKGQLYFTEKDIAANELIFNSFGGRSRLNIDTLHEEGHDYIHLDFAGKVDIEPIMNWLPLNFTVPATGKTSYLAEGRFCLGGCLGNQIQLSIESTLNNVTVSLPEPLFKSAETPWAFKFNFQQNPLEQKMSFSIDEHVVSFLNYKPSNEGYQMSSGSMMIGNIDTGVQVVEDQLAVNIHFDELSFLEWIGVFNTSIKGNQEKTSNTLESVTYFNVKKLLIGKIALHQVKAELKWLSDNTQLVSFSSDETKGTIKVLSDKKVDVFLEHLSLDLNSLTESESDIKQEGQQHISNVVNTTKDKDNLLETIDFSQWPEISIHCQSCKVNDIDLGEMKMTTSSEGDVFSINGNTMISQLMTAPFELIWDNSKDIQNSRLRMRIESSGFGKLLKHWGVKVDMEQTSGVAGVDLNWMGSPFDFAFQHLSGDTFFNMKKGYIKNFSDQEARVFSLLSVQSIFRRLSLDFEDIYKEGFFYSSMKGKMLVENGVSTIKTFKIDGKAAEVSLSGNINLVNKTLDQQALIVPKVTSSLPILAGWAVEPTTGFFVFLLSKLFKPNIDVITRIEYAISGPFDNVNVVELNKKTKKMKLPKEAKSQEKEEAEKAEK